MPTCACIRAATLEAVVQTHSDRKSLGLMNARIAAVTEYLKSL